MPGSHGAETNSAKDMQIRAKRLWLFWSSNTRRQVHYRHYVPLSHPGWQTKGNDGIYSTCRQVHTYTYLHIPMYTCTYMHIPTHTCTYMHIPNAPKSPKSHKSVGVIPSYTCNTYKYLHIHVIHADTCRYMLIYAYTYTYMHIHAHTQRPQVTKKSQKCWGGASLMHPPGKNKYLISAHASGSCTMLAGGRFGKVLACPEHPGGFQVE